MTHIYIPSKSISFQHGKFHTAASSHPRFDDIVNAAVSGDYKEAARLVDFKAVVQEAITGSKLELKGSSVLYKGRNVPQVLGERITELTKLGVTVDPLVKFLDNLWGNPSNRAVEELYGFLEAASLPITEDGHFLAYKSIRQDYTDHHTGTMDNSVGTTVEMERNMVDEDKDRTCSRGLHFAAFGYANSFQSSGRMVVLKINPKDVVSIPSDYDNEKGRACKYLILEEIGRGDKKLVNTDFVDTGTKDTSVPLRERLVEGETYEFTGNTFTRYLVDDGTKWFTARVEEIDDMKGTRIKEDTGLTQYLYGKWEVREVEAEDTYVPQVDNYSDGSLWDEYDYFQGTAKEFPVNRQTTYDLQRTSNDKNYSRFCFVSYDRKNDNLVFRKHNGIDFQYVTVKDLSEWDIDHIKVVHSSKED